MAQRFGDGNLMERARAVGLGADWIDACWIGPSRGGHRRKSVSHLDERGLPSADNSKMVGLDPDVSGGPGSQVYDIVARVVDPEHQREVRGGVVAAVAFDRVGGHHRSVGGAVHTGSSDGEVQMVRPLGAHGPAVRSQEDVGRALG